MINDPDFWRACFKKSPFVTVFMLLGTLIGLFAGALFSIFFWQAIAPGSRVIVVFGAVVLAFGFVGLMVGLVVGVFLDSIGGLFRGDAKKEKRKKRRSKESIYDVVSRSRRRQNDPD